MRAPLNGGGRPLQLMGWATGIFGLFTGHKDELNSPAENYVGVALAVLALGLYTQVKTGDDAKPAPTSPAEAPSSLEAPDVELLSSRGTRDAPDDKVKSKAGSKVMGVVMGTRARASAALPCSVARPLPRDHACTCTQLRIACAQRSLRAPCTATRSRRPTT